MQKRSAWRITMNLYDLEKSVLRFTKQNYDTEILHVGFQKYLKIICKYT